MKEVRRESNAKLTQLTNNSQGEISLFKRYHCKCRIFSFNIQVITKIFHVFQGDYIS